jgi:hypothetical protein
MERGNDWRLTGQERYLFGKTLVWKSYAPPGPDWDHGHCAFCWAKFTQNGEQGAYEEGYVTEDDQHWVCPPCFADFNERFHWTVKDE